MDFVHFVSLVGMIHKVLWSQRSHDESWVVCHKAESPRLCDRCLKVRSRVGA